MTKELLGSNAILTQRAQLVTVATIRNNTIFMNPLSTDTFQPFTSCSFIFIVGAKAHTAEVCIYLTVKICLVFLLDRASLEKDSWLIPAAWLISKLDVEVFMA